MYLKLPVVAFKVSYNITTTEGKAVYFSSVKELVEVLETFSSAKLTALSKEMSSIAERRYTWKNISFQYELLIKEALSIKNKTNVASELQSLDASFLEELQLAHINNSNLFYEN